MKLFQSSFGNVELTEERLSHILQFHPEIKNYQKLFSKICTSPDFIRKSKYDSRVMILYKYSGKNKFLAVVIKINARNFILTAYLTNKIQHLPI